MHEEQSERPAMTEEEKQAAREKGEATRQRRFKLRQAKRQEMLRAQEEACLKQRETDERYMKEALRLAKKAAAMGDVPIGCVIVKNGEILARGYNRRNADKTVLSHAEILALRRACRRTGDWRLEDCTLYVTLEPCPMCAGAIVQARIPTVVIGAENPKAGCAGSVLDLLHEKGFNHQVATRTGILKEECARILTDFFLRTRKRALEGDF
ncbi:MAG: tRNA adenosine(34) deaminase TadA [Clostridiales bacterium]|nr:tRNA adenosine(34) deaminase TadA [Clostridiales bacterium]